MNLVIFDFLNLMHRAYHAYPRTLKNSSGEQTNAVYGFTNILINSIKKLEPTHIVVATEEGPSFRHMVFSPYKENRGWRKERPEEAEEFDKQIPRSYEVLDALNIKRMSANGYEADDVIGTVSCLLKPYFLNLTITIVSSDMDFLQLINENVKVFRPARPPYIKEKLWDEKAVEEKYNLKPKQLIDFKALRGDPSDNIPGVFGIGEKVALLLIQKYGSIENIYKNIRSVEPPLVQKKLIQDPEIAVMSKNLATIVTNTPISINLKDCLWGNYNNQKVLNIFKELEFNSLINKLQIKNDKKGKNPEPSNKNQLNLL